MAYIRNWLAQILLQNEYLFNHVFDCRVRMSFFMIAQCVYHKAEP